MSDFAGDTTIPNKKTVEFDGALGDVHAMYSTYNGGEAWKKKRRGYTGAQPVTGMPPGLSEIDC